MDRFKIVYPPTSLAGREIADAVGDGSFQEFIEEQESHGYRFITFVPQGAGGLVMFERIENKTDAVINAIEHELKLSGLIPCDLPLGPVFRIVIRNIIEGGNRES